MAKYDGIEMLITPGDTLTSKKGFLFFSKLTDKEESYLVFKTKYLGDGHFEAMRKEPAETTRLK
jgi:hypothetical protein